MAERPIDIGSTLRQAHRLHESGQLQQAERLYRSILEIAPENPDANHLLGVLAYQLGRHEVAAQLIAKAIMRDSGNPGYLNSLGLVLAAQGRLDEALVAYDAAIAANPANADSHNSRGLVLQTQGKLEQALEAFRQALSIDARFAEAHNNCGNVLEAQGRIADALTAYRHAIAIEPGFAGAYSNMLLCLLYDVETDAQTRFERHREWNDRFAAGLETPARPHTNVPDESRRLRIGYVSPDFYRHPVASFIEPILRSHDRDAFDVVCYSNVARPDAHTAHLRNLADAWRSIAGMPDERAAELVREDGIDILVDLAGHTAGQRLLLFARRPAPIQVAYLGYPGTTGMSAMDYRITDAWSDPPGTTEALYTEELVRLPLGSYCFQPPSPEPETTPPIECAPGHVTFASFNNAAKISPLTIALWSDVLAAVPGARLLLKSKPFGDDATVHRVSGNFEQRGISPDRLEFLSWTKSPEDHLRLYERAHIALDTVPYSGCTTTCEALWMGVPVVTLDSPEPRSRMSLSVMSQAGISDCIAASPAAFVEIAKNLAADIGGLQALRSSLREKMRQSSLLDGPAFTRTLESAYRDMWRRYLSDSQASTS